MCHYPLITRTCCPLGALTPVPTTHLPPTFTANPPPILTLCPDATHNPDPENPGTNRWTPCPNPTPFRYPNTFSSYPILCPTCEDRFVSLYLLEIPQTEDRLTIVLENTPGSARLNREQRAVELRNGINFYRAALARTVDALFHERVRRVVAEWCDTLTQAHEDLVTSANGTIQYPTGDRAVYTYAEIMSEVAVVREGAAVDAEVVVRVCVGVGVGEMGVEDARGEVGRVYGRWEVEPEFDGGDGGDER